MKNKLLLLLFMACCCISTEYAFAQTEEQVNQLIADGRVRLQALTEQNKQNDAVGLSADNQYVLALNSEEAAIDGDKDSFDRAFITQRRTGNNETGKGSFFIEDVNDLNRLNELLKVQNNKPGVEIKTYLLLVDYVPILYKNKLTGSTKLIDLLSTDREENADNAAATQAAMDLANRIIDGITKPFIAQQADKVLYCGFLRFKVFEKKEYNQKDLYLYYPHTNVEEEGFGGVYKTIIANYIRSVKFNRSEKVSYVENIIKALGQNNEDYKTLTAILNSGKFLTITSSDEMEALLKTVDAKALSGLPANYRIHALKVLSSTTIPDSKEVLITQLIETVRSGTDADMVIEAMAKANDQLPEQVLQVNTGSSITGTTGNSQLVPNPKKGWCLLNCIINETSDATVDIWNGDNYKRLIKGFIFLCNQSPTFANKVKTLSATTDNDLLADRTIFYNYNSFWSKMRSTFLQSGTTLPFAEPKFDRNTTLFSNCDLKTKTELFWSYLLPNTPISSTNLDPFEPIVFVNQSDLGMLTDVNNGQKLFISPAIILKYADDKAWNETATDATMAAIDAASFATGYGEIKAGVTGMRKAWVLMDMANSGVNLALNASGASQNEQVKKLLAAYNAVTGGVAVTRMATGGVKSVYKLIKGKDIFKTEDILTLLKQLKEGGEDGLKNLSDEELASIEVLLKRICTEAKARGTALGSYSKESDEILGMIGKVKSAQKAGGATWTSIKSSITSRLAGKQGWVLKYSDAEIEQILSHGKGLKLPDIEIEDIIFNGCRPDKTFSATDLISQTNFWNIVKQRGYPNLFNSLQEYEQFSTVVKNLAKEWDLPANAIHVQGSSLRMSNVADIGDLDIAIKVDAATFDKLVARFEANTGIEKVIDRIGNNGKIGGVDMFKAPGEKGSLTGSFYPKFEATFGQTFQSKLGVPSIQISVVKEGSSIDVSPFLNLK